MWNVLRMDSDDDRETARLEAFSDGIIAFAITLLVLEIRVPHIEGATPESLWSALRDLWPNYLGYLISFATIGIMWANHHTIFRLIARTDHRLILANLLFLFFVAATPFSTALMADTLGRPAERVGIIVYSGWFLLTALSYTMLWSYASAGNRLIDPDASPDTVRALTARYRVGPPAYGLAFLIAFISPLASLALLLGLALAYVLPYGGRRAERTSRSLLDTGIAPVDEEHQQDDQPVEDLLPGGRIIVNGGLWRIVPRLNGRRPGLTLCSSSQLSSSIQCRWLAHRQL
jgi:uncharacterized membrane protein